jgi:hypothetical protein
MKAPYDPMDTVNLADLRRELDDETNAKVAVIIRPIPGLDWGRPFANGVCWRVWKECRAKAEQWGHDPERLCVRVAVRNTAEEPQFGGRLRHMIGD